jgi:hypothetical protein
MVVSLAALLGIQTDFLWVEKSEHSLVELGLMLAGSKVDPMDSMMVAEMVQLKAVMMVAA